MDFSLRACNALKFATLRDEERTKFIQRYSREILQNHEEFNKHVDYFISIHIISPSTPVLSHRPIRTFANVLRNLMRECRIFPFAPPWPSWGKKLQGRVPNSRPPCDADAYVTQKYMWPTCLPHSPIKA